MNKDEIINEIAKKSLSLNTLETRNIDSLDFHEHAVWQIKEALELTFEKGKSLFHKNFFNKRQIKDKISGETRDLEFKDVAEHFSKSNLCHIIATRGHMVIGDKEQRFCIIIRDDGTWELV